MRKPKLFSRTSASTVRRTIAIFREEAAKDKKALVLSIVFIPLGHIIYLVILPLIISFIIQSLINEPHNIEQPLWLVAGMIVSGFATVFINRFVFPIFFNHEERVTTSLTKRAMRGMLAHSHSFFANQKVGSIAGDINTFSRSYLALFDIIFLHASNILVSFFAGLVVIAIIAPLMLIPLSLLTAFIVIESINSLNRRSIFRNKRKELQSKLFGSIADIMGNQSIVRTFSTADKEIRGVVTERQQIEEVANEEIKIIEKSSVIRMSGLYFFQVLTMLIAIYLVNHSMVSIAALVFTVTYLMRVTGVMFNINSIVRTSEQAFLDASKVTEILSITPEVVDDKNADMLEIKNGSITIRNLDFHYADNKEEPVISNLSLSIPGGQRLGLVGKSGGGKSTLTHLLLRYMDVAGGAITIDEQDIAHVTQDSLRNAIAYVPQESFLFHRSLRENIAYGRPDATDDEVLSAAEKAYAMEFINRLPDGLDTIVGERGVKLSGGQRQRIAIARAILKDAPILILDEATSALDSESEAYIQKALAELMKNRTSIVIAHRLSTIAKLDRIIVLDKGKIVEDDTHTNLLQHNGTYAKLWHRQSGGFIEE